MGQKSAQKRAIYRRPPHAKLPITEAEIWEFRTPPTWRVHAPPFFVNVYTADGYRGAIHVDTFEEAALLAAALTGDETPEQFPIA